jgi:GDP-4-dehydro-6-deoxy-D-mannose reductase
MPVALRYVSDVHILRSGRGERAVHTVFVTGAEGFAGACVIRLLAQDGREVVAGVRNRARKLAHERQGFKAIVCDVADAINVARAVASVQPSGVLHLAGIARADVTAADPLLGYQSIVTAWANVLDAVRRTVPRAHVVMASASDVYGATGGNGRPISEAAPCQPTTTFGSLKRDAESIAHTFFRDYHLNVSIARPFGYFGARQPERFFLGAVARRLAEWNNAENRLFLPDLSCRRDLLHVEDVASAYQRLLAEGRPDEAYNICSGQAVSLREVVGELMAEFGLELELVEEATATGTPNNTAPCGDNSKLRSELGWEPVRTIQQAVHELAGSCRQEQGVGVH